MEETNRKLKYIEKYQSSQNPQSLRILVRVLLKKIFCKVTSDIYALATE